MIGKTTLRIARPGRGGAVGSGGADEPAYADYEVEAKEGMTLLDALESIRAGTEPSLRYRHSCHHGSCGTCGAVVDGKEALMCLVRLESLGPGPVLVEPLRKMDAVGDLAVDPSPLFESLPPGSGYLRRSEVPHGLGREEGGGYERFEACIECGICVSACPVPAGRPFSGPAALAMADRDREERPGLAEPALAFAARPEGVAACDRAFACSRACPQGVAPGRRIESLRKALAAKATGRS